MKQPSPYKCDYCPNTKAEGNHWWMRDRRQVSEFSLMPWQDELADERNKHNGEPRFEHICSQQCAVTALSQHLEKNTPAAAGSPSEATA